MCWYLPPRTGDKTVRPRRGKARNEPCVTLEVLERAKMVVAIVASVENHKSRFLAFSPKTGRHGPNFRQTQNLTCVQTIGHFMIKLYQSPVILYCTSTSTIDSESLLSTQFLCLQVISKVIYH
jgi:hypothetical protein